jgi:hypothetical protein
LLGGNRRYLIAAAVLRYYTAFWSSWIIAEFVRKRTEWIAVRAAQDGCSRTETRQRLREARRRINALIHELSSVLQVADYAAAPAADLSWLRDADDWPIMQTALAARAGVLVTDNSTDFPPGKERHGVLLLGSDEFLQSLYAQFPDASATIRTYLQEPDAV